ncbi:MAG: hypothetical protein JWP37_33 [Mucilaginibacter sp.]|nr:hypothetical protein [Mucilaginibacter sp.]
MTKTQKHRTVKITDEIIAEAISKVFGRIDRQEYPYELHRVEDALKK